MKRGIALVLMMAHLIAITGVFASVHFCGHALTHFSIGAATEEVACECQDVKKSDCCNDLVIKASTKQEATVAKMQRISCPEGMVAIIYTTSNELYRGIEKHLTTASLRFDPGSKERPLTGVWRI